MTITLLIILGILLLCGIGVAAIIALILFITKNK